MNYSTRKLIRAATLPLLVLTTTLGVVGLEVTAASPAVSQPDGPGGNSAQGSGSAQLDPTPTPVPPTPVPPLPIPPDG
jgi:hypothetical protein